MSERQGEGGGVFEGRTRWREARQNARSDSRTEVTWDFAATIRPSHGGVQGRTESSPSLLLQVEVVELYPQSFVFAFGSKEFHIGV
jgi:hypothetical protein